MSGWWALLSIVLSMVVAYAVATSLRSDSTWSATVLVWNGFLLSYSMLDNVATYLKQVGDHIGGKS